jgi:uncharacterized protein
MFYLDTSVIISALTDEQASSQARKWLAQHQESELAISDWTLTEVSSALSIKVRNGDLTPAQRAEAQRLFTEQFLPAVTLLDLKRDVFRQAAGWVAVAEAGLRAGDALHLALAAQNAAMLVTLDQRLQKAALRFGVAVEALEG